MHDFELFKRSGLRINDRIVLLADKGYIGIYDIHENSLVPFKKPKGGKLTAEEKTYNKSLSKLRIKVEHVIRRIKRFKMFSYRYRNKQRKHLMRFSLICGIYNWELGF